MSRPETSHAHGASLASKTILGLTAGIAVGLFFGEMAAAIGFVGNIYMNLLTMTVLPYIVVSLIGTVGQLTLEQAKLLVQRAGVVLLILWGIGLIMVVTIPLAFPTLQTASFFSTGILQSPAQIDLVGLFVPQNVFNALVDDTVPAVVLFCIAIGVALIGIKEKRQALGLFATISEALTRVTKGLTKMAPVRIPSRWLSIDHRWGAFTNAG